MQEKTLKKQLQKRLQKQRIKREYAKARRAGQAAKNTKEAAVKSANFTTTVAKKLQEAAQKHAALLVTIGAFAVLFDYDYDLHIVLRGDVFGRHEYHAGRELYERPGGDGCGRFGIFRAGKEPAGRN